MTNDIKTTENAFVRNLGNGVKAAEYLGTLVEAVVASRDTTIITRVLQRADKAGDAHAVGSIKVVVRNVWPGAKLGKGKTDGTYTLKIAGVEADDDGLGRLKTAITEGLSIRGKKFRETIEPKGEEDAFDVAKWAERTAKAHPDKLDAMIAALQALRSA